MSRLPGRLGTLVARDIMTPQVFVVQEADTVDEALRVLRSHHITGAPVVDERGRFVGILSLSDLLEIPQPSATSPPPSSLAHGSDGAAWHLFDRAQPLDAQAGSASVSSRMSHRVTSVVEDAPLVEVARAMCDGHWHRVPVVNAVGALCGIISTMDVLAAIVNAADELEEQSRKRGAP